MSVNSVTDSRLYHHDEKRNGTSQNEKYPLINVIVRRFKSRQYAENISQYWSIFYTLYVHKEGSQTH